jgi:AbrB family looped-hinge helix DNA binding protein
MGDRGRLVVPVELRERLNLHAGSALVLLETPQGVILATRGQVKTLVRSKLRGAGLVEELLSERRKLAASEDAA